MDIGIALRLPSLPLSKLPLHSGGRRDTDQTLPVPGVARPSGISGIPTQGNRAVYQPVGSLGRLGIPSAPQNGLDRALVLS